MSKIHAGKLFLIPVGISEKSATTSTAAIVKDTIHKLKYFAVENQRTARRFISALQLGIQIDDLHFSLLDKRTKPEELSHILKPLLEGQDMGIMSESGCPGVADPGNIAVRYAHEKGIHVIPLPGPSSILMALMASGLNGQKFRFHGYIPIEKKALKSNVSSLEKVSRKDSETQIFIEAPYRNNRLLDQLLAVCNPDTQLCIASDLSGKNEFIQTKRVRDWQLSKPDLHKQPTVFLMLAN